MPYVFSSASFPFPLPFPVHRHGADLRIQQTTRASGLRPPSRIPATTGLLEMTASENNSRAMASAIPTNSLKHKGSARTSPPRPLPPPQPQPLTDPPPVPEPAPKRKTLAERAGETVRPQPPNRVVKRSNTTSSLTSSLRNASTTSRPASAASAHRLPSTLQTSRSRTALSTVRAPSVTHEDPEEDSHGILPTKRKGTHHRSAFDRPPANSHRQPRNRDSSGSYTSTLSRLPPAGPSSLRPEDNPSFSFRNVSLNSAFRGLSLNSNNSKARNPSVSSSSSFPLPQEDPPCPQTPSCIPKPVLKTPKPPEKGLVIFKTPSTKYKIHTSSPGKVNFLTRGSNTPAPAWDTKGRLEDMELLYSQLKGQLDSAATEKDGMEEGLAVYKARRKLSPGIDALRNEPTNTHAQSPSSSRVACNSPPRTRH